MSDEFFVSINGGAHTVSLTPPVDATPDYADGDVLGGLQEITNAARTPGLGGLIASITVSNKVALAIGLRFIFFKSNPAATTFTENAALALNAADYDKVLGHVDVATGDQADLGTPDIATKLGINLPYKLAAGVTSLYVVCLAKGALNEGTASDLTFNYGLLRD